jgi:hypothetical protein
MKSNIISVMLGLFVTAVLGLTGCVSMPPSPHPPSFSSWKPVPNPQGGCYILYELKNTYDFTLSLQANITLLDEQGNTLGSAIGIFPPVLPGRSGRVNVQVFPFNISSGTCSDTKMLRIQAINCKREDDGAFLFQSVCSQIKALQRIQ